MEQFFESQRDHIFRNVEVLIYVFDIGSSEKEKDMMQFENCLKALKEHSPNTKIFVLVHKMDLVPPDDKMKVFGTKKDEIMAQVNSRFNVDCFATSIWDETLYKAWSQIVSILLPNIEVLKSKLQKLCETINADEVVLFERSTFLVISHYDARNHED